MSGPTRIPNRERIGQWIAALRSGEYAQGQHAMRRVTPACIYYCCLGVACEISGLGQWTVAGDYLIPGDRSLSGLSELPAPVADYYGLDSWVPLAAASNFEMHAAEANDSLGLPFAKIADYLEARYLTSGEASA